MLELGNIRMKMANFLCGPAVYRGYHKYVGSLEATKIESIKLFHSLSTVFLLYKSFEATKIESIKLFLSWSAVFLLYIIIAII